MSAGVVLDQVTFPVEALGIRFEMAGLGLVGSGGLGFKVQEFRGLRV